MVAYRGAGEWRWASHWSRARHILRSARRISFFPWSEAMVELCERCRAAVETKSEMVVLMP